MFTPFCIAVATVEDTFVLERFLTVALTRLFRRLLIRCFQSGKVGGSVQRSKKASTRSFVKYSRVPTRQGTELCKNATIAEMSCALT